MRAPINEIVVTDPEVDDLAKSIREHGQRRPIAVEKVGDHLVLIDGRKRLNAIAKLGDREVEVNANHLGARNIEWGDIISLAEDIPDLYAEIAVEQTRHGHTRSKVILRHRPDSFSMGVPFDNGFVADLYINDQLDENCDVWKPDAELHGQGRDLITLFTYAPAIIRKLLAHIQKLDSRGEKGCMTAADYRPGQHRHNAQVFIDVWHHDIVGVDDEGIFDSSDGSAGTIDFHTVVECILSTDKHHKLSKADAENAAAMVYHLTGPMQYD